MGQMTVPPDGGWANPGWGEPAHPPPPPAGGPAQPGPPARDDAAQQVWAQYGWAPQAPAAQKPGVVPLRPLGVGEILDGAITTIRRNPKITIGLAALIVTVQQLISVVAQVSTGSIASAFTPVSGLGDAAASSVGPFESSVALILLGGNLVLGTVLGAILTGVLMVVVGEAVLGRQPLLADVWGRVRPRFWALLGGSLLAGLLPFAGVLVAGVVGLAVGLATSAAAGVGVGAVLAVLLLIPGAYLWGVLSLTTPAITLERLGPIQGLRRSWQLAAPDFWRVWGIRALATLIGQFLTGIIITPFVGVGAFVVAGSGVADGGAAGGAVVGFLILSALGGVIAGAVVQPFLAGVIGLLYIDRRMRGEGLDITLAESARAARPTR